MQDNDQAGRVEPSAAPSLDAWRSGIVAGLVIAFAGVAAYSNARSVPFVFDDSESIPDNPSIRHLWTALNPPGGGITVTGRPVLNLSFAINYALGQAQVAGYHGLNVAIHVAAALALFGIMRRTLLCLGFGGPGAPLTLLACSIALLWELHPLQTESVTYIVQRAESLMGLFYLLTVYCFIRGAEFGAGGGAAGSELRNARCVPGCPEGTRRERPFGTRLRLAISALRAPSPAAPPPAPNSSRVQRVWFGLSWVACLLGMGTKEVMVSAPVIVFLYDRTFVAGSFRDAWRRWRYYCCLASTWIPLAALVYFAKGRGGTSGLGAGVPLGQYLLTQPPAIAHYLRLVVWPHPLIFDYGAEWISAPGKVMPAALAVALLAAAALYFSFAPGRGKGGRALGFAGVFFFAILAPSSLVPGGKQTIAEHRMYLALAPVVAVCACGLFSAIWRGAAGISVPFRTTAFAGIALALALALGLATENRNGDFESALGLWRLTASERPNNPNAHYNLGVYMIQAGDESGAIAEYEEAIRLKPDFTQAHNDVGVALTTVGRYSEAVPEFREAIRLKPDYTEAHYDLAIALEDMGRTDEAIAAYDDTLAINPDYAEAHNNLAIILAKQGRFSEAIPHFREVVKLRPASEEARHNLDEALSEAARAK